MLTIEGLYKMAVANGFENYPIECDDIWNGEGIGPPCYIEEIRIVEDPKDSTRKAVVIHGWEELHTVDDLYGDTVKKIIHIKV